jgi:peptidyl-prolyl cis-trans isomerase C
MFRFWQLKLFFEEKVVDFASKSYMSRLFLVRFMPNKVHCAHILVRTETEAKNIKARLDKGEKFGLIAKNVSLCPSGKNGGDLGTFARGRMAKGFEKAAFSLEKGKISDPVKTQFGYHIIKRLE